MVKLLATEFLKLKRSQMFLISIIGAATAPFVCFIAYLSLKSKQPNVPILFSEVFSQTNMYVLLLVGVSLYGVITAYLFNREYAENTLKNLLSIPVSRISFFASKLIMLFILIMVMTTVAWGLTVIFGLIGQFQGLSAEVLIKSLKEYLLGGTLLFLLSTPTILITLLSKNYVPTIVFTLIITMVNVLIGNSQYVALYPWSAVYVIASNSFVPQYPPKYSFIVIIATSLFGFVASILHFSREDIR